MALQLRAQGVLTMLSPWGRIYTSFAHDEAAWAALALVFRAASRP